MNMTATNYPKAGAYVRLWQRIREADPDTPTQCPETRRNLKVADLQRTYRNALHNRINSRGGIHFVGRKHSDHYQSNMRHDCRAVREWVNDRIIFRQLINPDIRARFSHYIWTDDEF